MKFVVVDLDGTLCNTKHREHLAQAGQWDEFHPLLVEDEVNRDVADLCDIYSSAGGIQLIFCTGRNARWWNETLWWFGKHNVFPDYLLMRPDSNYESDAIIKPKLLREFLSDGGHQDSDVMMILEDRDKMVDCWRNLGFNCWQVRASGY